MAATAWSRTRREVLGSDSTVKHPFGVIARLSTLELKGEAVGDVLKRADTALYRAKHDGRNRVVAQAA